MRIKITGSGVVIPRDMLPDVEEVDVRMEDGLIVITPLYDPGDPLWEMGNDPVTCGLS
jgi:virulence-associated protein VagC